MYGVHHALYVKAELMQRAEHRRVLDESVFNSVHFVVPSEIAIQQHGAEFLRDAALADVLFKEQHRGTP